MSAISGRPQTADISGPGQHFAFVPRADFRRRRSDQAILKELREHGWGTVRGLPVGNATAVAIAQCQEGDAESAIPVLEQQMRDRLITLPSRG
jgi:hypothetical protein